MAGDDLYDPLGLEPARREPGRGIPFRLIAVGFLAAMLFSGFVLLRPFGDPSGDAPQAVAAIVPEPVKPAAILKPDPPPDTEKNVAPQKAIEDAADLEKRSGVKVVRSNGAGAPGATIIEVPQVLGVTLAPAPDPRLVEQSRYGPLPRIGPDGARAADVYARPVVAMAARSNAPRVALVVGALGLSQSATDAAIAGLPGTVTLAFAPYGRNLEASVSAARAQGHEVILQLPMEPIDYPQTNPGPHVLLSSAGAAENTDNLHWLMSRFTGYAGVANFLGAKLTADAAAFSPVLREIADRGLFYLDDGSSAQSLALALAADKGLPAAKADVLIDATPDGIDAALVKLEAIARDKGVAIGMASALPESLEKIGRFARGAEAHGLVLIPLSAAVEKAAPSVVTGGP